jgi:hypothetical protein
MGLTNYLTMFINMKVYAILEQRWDYEYEITKVFSSRKKARKYILEKYYSNCDLKDAKILNSVDAWIDEKELE